ncbi:hypothetical protein N0V88_006322 [Collariella sp. IMI 366227]|nr:hypothetical protein N0V88_006322 [Collariella sp. IMI 366227]
MRLNSKLFLTFLLGCCAAQTTNSERQIAIIGAGPAGASTAYHLKKFADLAGVHVNITLFEKTDHIGGRTLTVNAFNDPSQRVELGATLFADANQILNDSLAEFDLEVRERGPDAEPKMGIWDGDRFIFTEDERAGKIANLLNMAFKYGPVTPKRAESLTAATVGKFLQLYNAPFFPFTSLTKRVAELGLGAATFTTGEEFLQANDISGPFSREVIQAAVRANYVTNLANIHGLDTMVSLAAAGAKSVQGGNWQIFREMAHRSGASVLLNTAVVSLEKTQGKYTVKATSGSTPGNPTAHPVAFDNVIIANPLQFSGMSVAKAVLKTTIEPVSYVNLHVTLFTSKHRFRPGFFGLRACPPLAPKFLPELLGFRVCGEAPGVVITTLAKSDNANSGADGVGKAGFFSLSGQGNFTNPQTKKPEYLYKIFSPQAVTPEFLSNLLGGTVPSTFTGGASPISWYFPHTFNAFPKAIPRTSFPEHVVGDGVYYTSAMEPFISTMETSALMGKNVAQLIVDDMRGISSGGPVWARPRELKVVGQNVLGR